VQASSGPVEGALVHCGPEGLQLAGIKDVHQTF
jgi:hypothetical protein